MESFKHTEDFLTFLELDGSNMEVINKMIQIVISKFLSSNFSGLRAETLKQAGKLHEHDAAITSFANENSRQSEKTITLVSK